MTKLMELSKAADEYGRTSWTIYNAIRKLGTEIVACMSTYLGPDSIVFGVPPRGEWSANEHHDQKFTKFGMIAISPYEMGLAVKVPHIRDEGHFWVRTIIEFTPEGGEFLVGPIEGTKIRVAFDFNKSNVQDICHLTYESIISLYSTPVRIATKGGQNQLGFTIPDSRPA